MKPEDLPLSSMKLSSYIVQSGYRFEEHKIATDDGYILTAYRIPGKFSEESRKKQPILLQHGLLDQGGTWFFNEAEKTLPFQLVEDGYDVWILNSRGTAISNEHLFLSPSDKNSLYWNFTVHEMAQFDLPESVDYILEETGAEQVVYVGHSQGTSQWFLANALDETFNSKFKAFVGIAPVVYAGEIHAPILDTLVAMRLPEFFESHLLRKVLHLSPETLLIGEFAVKLLPRTTWAFVEGICGFNQDKTHIDMSRMSLMAINDVGGTSAKNLLHWT